MRRPLNWLVVAISLCFLSVGLNLSADDGPGSACHLESDGVYFTRAARHTVRAAHLGVVTGTGSSQPNYPEESHDPADAGCYVLGEDSWAAYWATSARL